MRHVLRLAVVLAAGAMPTSAQAQNAVTPDGPATIRAYWNGPHTAEGRAPEVLVGWSVTVGANSKAGPVRLRVLTSWDGSRVKGSGPTEWLPAEPGTYSFKLPTGIPYDYRESGLSLDQEVGGHALLAGSGRDQDEVHVFRPPLADGPGDLTPTQRFTNLKMLITGVAERDVDNDLLGDDTQDVGDLRVLRARLVRHLPNGNYRVEARVRNVGTTVRHLPGIRIDDLTSHCDRPWHSWAGCVGPALAPGQEEVLAVEYLPRDQRKPTSVTVRSEGPDLRPDDNTMSLTPRLTVAKAQGATPRVRLGADRPGEITLTARIAGLRITRTITFARADRRVVRLLPRTRADRRRLARALRRAGRLTATVTATMDGGRAVTQARY